VKLKRVMKPRLLKLLRCPICRLGKLSIDDAVYKNGEVQQGELQCLHCGMSFPVEQYVPRFVAGQKYVTSFGYEWNMFPTVLYGSANADFLERFKIDPDSLSDSRVLDVGCGSGRFLRVFSNESSEVVGVDLSHSVDQAFMLCGERPNVHIVQADLFELPLEEKAFDLVFSFGALHHTPDTKRAFFSLPKFVKPGGKLAVFVYAKWTESGQYWVNRAAEALGDSYRTVSSKMPRFVLFFLSHAAIPLYSIKRIPLAGRILQAAIPTSGDPNWKIRVLNTFDWYSPKWQWKHTAEEVVGWFEQAGFEDILVLEHPVTVIGKKPMERGA
jgi:SAM-dependent methyltransferase